MSEGPGPSLPKSHPRITKTSQEEIDAFDKRFIGTSRCWRGYVGTWEITNGKLYLVRLRGRYRLRGHGPLFADWFTGELCSPWRMPVSVGEITVVEKVGMQFDIRGGEVVASRIIDDPSDAWTEPDDDIPF